MLLQVVPASELDDAHPISLPLVLYSQTNFRANMFYLLQSKYIQYKYNAEVNLRIQIQGVNTRRSAFAATIFLHFLGRLEM